MQLLRKSAICKFIFFDSLNDNPQKDYFLNLLVNIDKKNTFDIYKLLL